MLFTEIRLKRPFSVYKYNDFFAVFGYAGYFKIFRSYHKVYVFYRVVWVMGGKFLRSHIAAAHYSGGVSQSESEVAARVLVEKGVVE